MGRSAGMGELESAGAGVGVGVGEEEGLKLPVWCRPVGRMYRYNRDIVGIADNIQYCSNNREVKPIRKQEPSPASEDHCEELVTDIESEKGSTEPGSTNVVDEFLIRSYAQQIKERNIVKVQEIGVRSGVGRFSGPVTPIISSATNIRDFYIKSLEAMR